MLGHSVPSFFLFFFYLNQEQNWNYGKENCIFGRAGTSIENLHKVAELWREIILLFTKAAIYVCALKVIANCASILRGNGASYGNSASYGYRFFLLNTQFYGYRQWIVRATMEYSPSLNGCFPLTSTVVHIHCSTIRETFDLWITQIILEISRKYHN